MKIIEGTYLADKASGNIAHSNVYVVVNNKNLLIIDTGTPGNAKKIVEYVQEIGFQPQSVSTIVLTHYHMDHIGSLKELKTITGAKVAVSKIDAAYVSGKQPYPKPKNLLMRAVPLFMKAEPVDVDITLEDGARIGNLLVIETPGHTEGSIMLYDEQGKVLFSGDTLRFDGKKITGGPKQFTWDELKEKESIEKISKLDFDLLLPGHGIFLRGDASRLVEEYLQTIQN